MCSLEWLERLKCRATGLDASLSSFSTSRRCSRNRSPNRLPVSPMYSFLHNVRKNCTSFRIILQYFKVVKDDSFYWVIARVKCESEWNSIILFLL